MFFKDVAIQVYRLTAGTDNLSDPTYSIVTTVYGSVQPFTGDDALHQSQVVENIRDLLVFTDPLTDIKKTDELFYNNENRRVAYVERFQSGVLDHAEVMTTDSQWINNVYTIIFDSQGGSTITSIIANQGGKLVEPTPPTKTGFVFDGWYKEIACTTEWMFTVDQVWASTTLYAKWIV